MARRFEAVKGAPADTKLPVRGSKNSAGFDFFAPVDILCRAKSDSDTVYLNIKAKMGKGEWLEIRSRSGLFFKHGVYLPMFGVIDADFYGNPDNDGNIAVKFHNNSNVDYVIKKGERCCQGIFQKYYVTDDDNTTAERVGGLGSTGKE